MILVKQFNINKKILIPDIAADKELNTIADKIVKVNKERNIAADKKWNTIANKGINTNQKQDNVPNYKKSYKFNQELQH